MNKNTLSLLEAMGIQAWQLRGDAKKSHPFSADGINSDFPSKNPPPPVKNNPSTFISCQDPTPWETLQWDVKNCVACGLNKTRTQTVFGVGNPSADLMIIGEAPGFYEDKQGEPFVGRAGQLLNAMLSAIGYDRQTVYIANILKCRPPNNRDPLPEEIALCTPFLEKQIEWIKPKLLLSLGRIAAQYLLNEKSSMGQLRGKFYHYRNTPLIATFHPAYLLRNPIDKRKAYEDLKLVARTLKQG